MTQQPKIYGGPFDGSAVPLHWRRGIETCYVSQQSLTVCVYYRRLDGGYLFHRYLRESELPQVKKA